MTLLDKVQRLALAGTVALGGMLGGVALAAAQDDPEWEPDYYESALTGYEIEISDDEFFIDDVVSQEYDDGENEQVYIESEYSTVQVSFFDDPDSPEETVELWIGDLGEGMDSLEVVDNGVDGDVTWYYVEGEYEELTFVYYVQVAEDVDGNVDMLESVLTLEGNLVNAVEAAQEGISIDGDPFMDDVDLDDLEEFLDGGEFRTGGDDSDDADAGSTPEDDADDDSPSASDRRRLPAESVDEDSPDDSTPEDEEDEPGT